MSIVLPSNTIHGMSSFMGKKSEKEEEVNLDSCSSSSIGRNSDLSNSASSEGEGAEDIQVQSSYKGPLGSMEALEQVLPIRRGISKFYCGKSKSFASLASAAFSSSIREIAKPDNDYNRRRRNLLAFSINWDKKPSLSPRSNWGGISKRPIIKSSRSTLALAVAMSSSESLNTIDDSNSNSTSPSSPQSASPSWRSFSLADLRRADAAAAATHHNNNHL